MRQRIERKGIVAAALALPARAESYPVRPVRVIVPFPPGGGVDLTAMSLAEPL